VYAKCFESLFGFISVLPGAFSAYRWDALKKTETEDDAIMEKYLRIAIDEKYTESKDYTVTEANMYLAEDRVLCLEIFARKKYILKYLPDSVAWFFYFYLNKKKKTIYFSLGLIQLNT